MHRREIAIGVYFCKEPVRSVAVRAIVNSKDEITRDPYVSSNANRNSRERRTAGPVCVSIVWTVAREIVDEIVVNNLIQQF